MYHLYAAIREIGLKHPCAVGYRKPLVVISFHPVIPYAALGSLPHLMLPEKNAPSTLHEADSDPQHCSAVTFVTHSCEHHVSNSCLFSLLDFVSVKGRGDLFLFISKFPSSAQILTSG